MTAPAVVRRWNDPGIGRAGRPTSGNAEPGVVSEVGIRVGEAVAAFIRACALRLRRVASLGALLLSGLVLHAALAPHLAVREIAPDGLLVAVVAVAVSKGSRTGAGFGFAAGIGADLFLTTPLGTSALAYTLAGHVLGRSARPRSSAGSAAALCRPGSTCFACRNGQSHARPSRARHRAAMRRAALRRSIVLAVAGVAAARFGAVLVATALAGVPFPGTEVLLRIAGTAALSAPLGPAATAALRRIGRRGRGPA